MSIKISQLSSSTSITGSDLIVTVTTGANSSLITAKSTVQQVFNYVTSTITDLTLDNITVLNDTILGNSSSDLLTVNATSQFLSDLTASNVGINNNLTISGEISGTNIQITSITGSTGIFTGDILIQGKLTAKEYYTEIISASIIYESGSTKFGDDPTDIHIFTGSILVSGDLSSSGKIITNNDLIAAGNLTINGGNVSTNSTIVNLFTSSVDTVNIANAANLISIGSNSGSTNINNSLSISNALYVTGTTLLHDNLSGTTAQFRILTGSNISGILAEFEIITGSNISGTLAQFQIITGSRVSGTLAEFETITGLNVSGTISKFQSITGSYISGTLVQFEIITGSNISGTLARFHTVTGSNVSGTLAHFQIVTSSNVSGILAEFQSITGSNISGTLAQFETIISTNISGSDAQYVTITSSNVSAINISSSFYIGNGKDITNLTASNIDNFTNDVRNQFIAGTNVTIVSGVISSTGGGGGGGFTGSFSTAVNTITGNLVLDDTYHTVYANASGGNIVITLPSASTYNGIEYIIKKTDISTSTVVTISGSGGELIDGYTYIPLDYRFEGITLQSDGTSSWFINADVSSEITLIAQGYVNPIGTNNLYILSGTAAAGFDKSIQFNDSGTLAGSNKLIYNKNTEILSGTRVEFTVITASIVSASQYIGLTGGGDVLSNANNTFNGTNTFNQYVTASITGNYAKFAEITGTLFGTASNADLFDGLSSSAFAKLSAANTFPNINIFNNIANQFTGSLNGTSSFANNSHLLDGLHSSQLAQISSSNIFSGINRYDNYYLTATIGITGSDAKFTNITGTLFGTASYAQNTNLFNGLNSTAYAVLNNNNIFTNNNEFYNYITGNITGSDATFTVISASIISASQYIGIIGGGSSNPAGPNQSIQFNSGSQLSGSSNLIYNYNTNILSGTVAQFTQLTASDISGRLINLTTHVSTVTASISLSSNSHVILGSASVSNIILTLPSASISSYRQYIIKKIDPTAFKIILSGSGTEKIDGINGRQIGTQYETVTLISDGTSQWFIL